MPEQTCDDIGVTVERAMWHARCSEVPDLHRRIHDGGADCDVRSIACANRTPAKPSDRRWRADRTYGIFRLIEIPDAQLQVATARREPVAVLRVPVDRQTRTAMRRDRSLARRRLANVPHLNATAIERRRKVVAVERTELYVAHRVVASVERRNEQVWIAKVPVLHSAILRARQQHLAICRMPCNTIHRSFMILQNRLRFRFSR